MQIRWVKNVVKMQELEKIYIYEKMTLKIKVISLIIATEANGVLKSFIALDMCAYMNLVESLPLLMNKVTTQDRGMGVESGVVG